MNYLHHIFCGLSLAGSLLSSAAQPLIQPEVLHVFPNRAYPNGPVPGPDGALYGTTKSGGFYRFGDVYRVTTNGAFTSIAEFSSCPDCGEQPDFPPVLAGDGKFYGGTAIGNPSAYHNRSGSIYSVTTDGILNAVAIFYQTNGGIPSSWAVGRDGSVYGTTWQPGQDTYGNVFKVSTNGEVSTLRWLTGTNEGYDLTLGVDGNFYGPGYAGFTYPGFTNQVMFRMTPDAEFTIFEPLLDGTNGSGVIGKLTLGWDGNFYGGAFVRVTTTGVTTLLASLNGTIAFGPSAPLARGDDGNFYGTTAADTLSKLGEGGTVFRASTNGILKVLSAFSNTNGAVPRDLAYGSDGNLYGTTISENPGSSVLFRINVTSVPPVIQSSAATNRQFTFSWSAHYGRSYQPQYCTDMNAIDWSNLGGTVLATNSIMTTSDLASPGSQKFFRVLLLPAP
jgi:uncharacterized repeat protein (TIGR03803 family)